MVDPQGHTFWWWCTRSMRWSWPAKQGCMIRRWKYLAIWEQKKKVWLDTPLAVLVHNKNEEESASSTENDGAWSKALGSVINRICSDVIIASSVPTAPRQENDFLLATCHNNDGGEDVEFVPYALVSAWNFATLNCQNCFIYLPSFIKTKQTPEVGGGGVGGIYPPKFWDIS